MLASAVPVGYCRNERYLPVLLVMIELKMQILCQALRACGQGVPAAAPGQTAAVPLLLASMVARHPGTCR